MGILNPKLQGHVFLSDMLQSLEHVGSMQTPKNSLPQGIGKQDT